MRFLSVVMAIALTFHPATADEVDYLKDVKPLLAERCGSCHGALAQKGKLRLDAIQLIREGGRNGDAIEPGKSQNSLLIEAVLGEDRPRMPPEGEGAALTAQQIQLLKNWIDQGAKGPETEPVPADLAKHWAFQKVTKPTPPTVSKPGWNAHPIDRFIAQTHAKEKLTPANAADKATLLRRVTLDLTGIPPTRHELHDFLADESAEAFEKVVDRLLASPHYGERWGRRWMDVWRYSDWYGRRSTPDVLNSYGQIWRWRDWIVTSLNEDRGYDEMVKLMLAADELRPGDHQDQVATGFVVRNFFRWNYNNWMRDNVEHTAKAFLGLTMNCCHCHDHKYDPIRQDEYFQFRAIFEPIEIRHDRWPGEADPGEYPKYTYGSAYKPITTGMVRVMDEKPDAPTRFYTGGDERNLVEGREPIPPGVPSVLGGVYRPDPKELPPESWYPGLRAFVREEELTKRRQALELSQAEAAKAEGDAERNLAHAAVRAAKADLAALEARICADDVAYLGAAGDKSETARAASFAERVASLRSFEAKLAEAELGLAKAELGNDTTAVSKAEAARNEAIVKRDQVAQKLSEINEQYTPLSPIYPKRTSGRRTALAEWLTHRDNPLTARVAVNHIWAGHFGQPVVETTNNFGLSGQSPSHPELLDWLAADLMENGWQMKRLHKLIVTSRTYQMSTRGDAEANSHDQDNVFLWRYPTNRVEAEVVRDSLLAVAGELDATMGGPDVPQEEGLTSNRKSLYFTHHGERRMEFLDLFDAANPCDAYRRSSSVLPQQALALTNSELAQRLSRSLAVKLAAEAESDSEFIRLGFEQVLSRSPTKDEAEASARFLAELDKLYRETASSEGSESPTEPELRAKDKLILALFSHSDFITVR